MVLSLVSALYDIEWKPQTVVSAFVTSWRSPTLAILTSHLSLVFSYTAGCL